MSDSKPPIVVDASVIMKWYFPELYSAEALSLLDEFEVCTVDVAVAQVATALRKRIRTGEIKPVEGKLIVDNLLRLPIRFATLSSLASNAIELSSYSNRSFNESLYFVLALKEKTKYVTADFSWYSMLSTGKLKNYVEFVNRI